ncbi:YopX family protein [Clostridium sp. MB40-C1]|uniref:YopX family protein n=1 Tax=Clostridium sp. MB40-C1 TaxID=3070996 RepID=UPI0027E18017|nr:YopX family protein [Clostridium sp. MB40-C1]WMJ81947.1 YopX family protein [Clostridium sp. MB40-C1]
MKAKDLTLRVVNETEKDKFEIKEFKPYITYESFIGCILGDAEILRPIGIKDVGEKMIYENYIIAVEEITGDKRKYKCVIKYNDITARFEAIEIRKDMKYIHMMNILNGLCKLKVIGNIYQNPELLSS